jgi:hypothetical protein
MANGHYSTLPRTPFRILTLNNIRAKQAYIKHITKESSLHHLWEKANELYKLAITNTFTDAHEDQLNALDKKLTEILLYAEGQCAKKQIHQNPWSPTLCVTSNTLVYWQCKCNMAARGYFRWNELSALRSQLNINDEEHHCTDRTIIRKHLCNARKEWRNIKKNASELRATFLSEQADDYASRMNMDKEQALKAILQFEESKRPYRDIQAIAGHKKDKKQLTQITVPDPEDRSSHITLTTKEELETAIQEWNQQHA